ncbi:MAG TPA: adenylate/guanylate cyclase domain-containing protein [Anaerolineae bacterium]|nr:adenylate/guanylate cyclase domain-containing protein [Anaerolineae bacterium]
MRCPECGAANAAEARFCSGCGTRIRAAEPASTEILPARLHRLIPPEYAARLHATRGRVGNERRLVTILFCDIKGSTAMAETLDPEDVLEIMEGAFEFLIAPVYEHEGTLARLMGDAILAFFGAPLAHEDDPERAIRAGLEIVSGAKAYAAKLEKERGIRGFNVRVGIHTGQVVVGEVGSDLRAEYTAMGDAVNLAARMEQNAPAGGVLITHAVYRHVRGVFDVQAQPPLEVKGRAEPVQAYLVERAKPWAWRVGSRGVEGIETRMVGRELELTALQLGYREVVEGSEARVVTVVGEAGVGKSRLLDEFAAWLELEPLTVWYLRGRAVAEGQALAYSVWRDLFAYRFGILETDSAVEALRKFREGMAGLLEPDQASLVGHLIGFDFSSSPAVAAMLGSESFRQIATAYLVDYLGTLAASQLVVMLLEDLHWADDSTLDLVAEVVDRLADAPLLVVAAARPVLIERRPNWGEGYEAYSRLELKPLTKRASQALVREILQKVPEVPEAVAQLVVEGAEGNPFYAEELVKMLVEDGVIVPGEEEWQVEMERLAQVRVPPTLTAVLQARLDGLPREEKEVLQRASVVGREFWSGLVGELASDSVQPDDVRPLLSALRAREMVYRRERSAFAGTEEYLFKHAVLRDVTYETVLLKARRQYHAQVAAWLEGHAGERLGEYLGLIAGHYELAREGEKAAGYFRRSGEELLKVSSHRAAKQAFERALALLPSLPAEQGGGMLPASGAIDERAAESLRVRADLRLRLGRTWRYLDEYEKAWTEFEAALELARAVGERRLEARALAQLGGVRSRQGIDDEAVPLLRKSLALAKETGDDATQALGARLLADVLRDHGEFDDAARLAAASKALYEQAGDRQGMVAALSVMGMVAWARGAWDEAKRWYGEGLALAEQIGDLYRTGLALLDLARLALNLDDPAGARRYLERGRAVADRIGARALMAYTLENLGSLALSEGALQDARACLEEAIAIEREIGDSNQLTADQVVLGQVLVLQGRYDAAWSLLIQALRWFASSGQIWVHAVVEAVGQMGVHLGHLQRGAELLGLASHAAAGAIALDVECKREMEILREALTADELDAAFARGAQLDLSQVAAEILACATADAYWGTLAEGAPDVSDRPQE